MPSFKSLRLGMSVFLVPNGKKSKLRTYLAVCLKKSSTSELPRCVGFILSTVLYLTKWKWDYFKNTLFLELWLYNMLQTLFMGGVIYLDALIGKGKINLERNRILLLSSYLRALPPLPRARGWDFSAKLLYLQQSCLHLPSPLGLWTLAIVANEVEWSTDPAKPI